MKTIKRVIAVIAMIILALVVGYLIFTGGQLADAMNEAATIIGGTP